MLRWLPPVVLLIGCPRKAPEDVTLPDMVWEERVERALTALTKETLVPGDPETIAAAGWGALGESAGHDLAAGVANRVANGSIEPAQAWGVIAAMVASVGDAHTMLVAPAELEQFDVPIPVELGDGYLLFLPVQRVGAPGADAQLRVEPDERVANRSVADLRAGRDPQMDAALRWLAAKAP